MRRLQTDGCLSIGMIVAVLVMGIAAIAFVVAVSDLAAKAAIR